MTGADIYIRLWCKTRMLSDTENILFKGAIATQAFFPFLEEKLGKMHPTRPSENSLCTHTMSIEASMSLSARSRLRGRRKCSTFRPILYFFSGAVNESGTPILPLKLCLFLLFLSKNLERQFHHLLIKLRHFL